MIDIIIYNVFVLCCLFVASILMFNELRWILFYDTCNKQDTPNRWKKDADISRFGGVGLFIIIILVFQLWSGELDNFVKDLFFIFTIFSVYIVALLDDYKSLNISERLLTYFFGAAIISCNLYFEIENFWLFSLYSISSTLIIFFYINSFNFFDNIDSSCISVSCIILFFLSLISEDLRLILIIVLMIPFIFLNAKGYLMLGDSGSCTLGFFLSSIAVYLWQVKDVNPFSLLLIFVFPTVDTVFVLSRRLIEKRKPWIGGTDHLTHILARKFSWQATIFVIVSMSVGCGLLGLLLT